MTEQCRNARLDSHTVECRHVFSHSVADLVFCPGDHLFFFWFLSYKMKNNLFMSNASRLNDEHCIRLISSLWLLLFFNGLLITNCFLFPFVFFVEFLFLLIGLHPAEHCWTSNDWFSTDALWHLIRWPGPGHLLKRAYPPKTTGIFETQIKCVCMPAVQTHQWLHTTHSSPSPGTESLSRLDHSSLPCVEQNWFACKIII